jgi:hypothetical protein
MNPESDVIAKIDALERDYIDDRVDWQMTDSPAAHVEHGGSRVTPAMRDRLRELNAAAANGSLPDIFGGHRFNQRGSSRQLAIPAARNRLDPDPLLDHRDPTRLPIPASVLDAVLVDICRDCGHAYTAHEHETGPCRLCWLEPMQPEVWTADSPTYPAAIDRRVCDCPRFRPGAWVVESGRLHHTSGRGGRLSHYGLEVRFVRYPTPLWSTITFDGNLLEGCPPGTELAHVFNASDTGWDLRFEPDPCPVCAAGEAGQRLHHCYGLRLKAVIYKHEVPGITEHHIRAEDTE